MELLFFLRRGTWTRGGGSKLPQVDDSGEFLNPTLYPLRKKSK
jgi:hypothetical protein